MIKNLSVLVLSLFLVSATAHAKDLLVTKDNIIGKWQTQGAYWRGQYIPLRKDEKKIVFIFTETEMSQVNTETSQDDQDPLPYNIVSDYVTYAGSQDNKGQETRIFKISKVKKNSMRISPANIKTCANCAQMYVTRVKE